MKKVIILNAPPGAGKDTIGGLICKHAPQYVVFTCLGGGR